MWSSGGYPLGAEYDPRAPWNERPRERRCCAECNGEGYRYWIADVRTGDERTTTEKGYKMCPTTRELAIKHRHRFYRIEEERCEICGGEGEVEIDVDDYFNFDDDDRHEERLIRKYNY